MDVLLYGIFATDLAKQLTLSREPILEVARYPFAINIGIFAALFVPFLAQSKVRFGLIWYSFLCLFIMTGLIFTGLFLLACIGVFLLARLLQRLKNISWRTRYLASFLLINLIYLPLFFVIFPPFDGFMSVGELILLWGPAFAVLRSIHYLHMVCRDRVDVQEPGSFARFVHYLVHFPSFWFGPYQKFQHFCSEVETCHERLTRANRLKGAKRIFSGVLKFFILFHVFNLSIFNKSGVHGPFADALFASAADIGRGELWMLIYLFTFRIVIFMSAISDGVIGMNLMMGIRVPENSLWPLYAKNIREFWQRWNVQVMVFLRDEIFLPLRKFRKSNLAVFAVFSYSGFWHFPSLSAAVAFPLLQVFLFWLTRKWEAFWKFHDDKGDRISRVGKRFALHDSTFSGFVGSVFVFNTNVLSVIFIHDHFFGGARILPRLFGLD